MRLLVNMPRRHGFASLGILRSSFVSWTCPHARGALSRTAGIRTWPVEHQRTAALNERDRAGVGVGSNVETCLLAQAVAQARARRATSVKRAIRGAHRDSRPDARSDQTPSQITT